jgi:phage shock protein C
VNPRRLYRCRHDRQLAGVASGMAEYLGLDPTVVRILWILSVFFGGFSILVYIVLAFVVPLEPIEMPSGIGPGTVSAEGAEATAAASHWVAPAGHEHRARGEGGFGLGLGVLLVVFGSIALLGALTPDWIVGVSLGPAFLIGLGVALLVVATRRPTAQR